MKHQIIIYPIKSLYFKHYSKLINKQSEKIYTYDLMILFLRAIFTDVSLFIKCIRFISKKDNLLPRFKNKELPFLIFYLVSFSKLLKLKKIKNFCYVVLPHPSLIICRSFVSCLKLYKKSSFYNISFIFPGCGKPNIESIKYVKLFNSKLLIPAINLDKLEWIQDAALRNIEIQNINIDSPNIDFKINFISIFLGYDKTHKLYIFQFLRILLVILKLLNFAYLNQKINLIIYLHPRLSYLKLLNFILRNNFNLKLLNNNQNIFASYVYSFSPSINQWIMHKNFDKRININIFEGKMFFKANSLLKKDFS